MSARDGPASDGPPGTGAAPPGRRDAARASRVCPGARARGSRVWPVQSSTSAAGPDTGAHPAPARPAARPGPRRRAPRPASRPDAPAGPAVNRRSWALPAAFAPANPAAAARPLAGGRGPGPRGQPPADRSSPEAPASETPPGQSCTTTWALAPPAPNEDTPAMRGPSGCQGPALRCNTKGLSSNARLGLTVSACSVGASVRCFI